MTRQQELLKEIILEKRKSIIDQLSTDAERQLIAACDECERLVPTEEGENPAHLAALAKLGEMLGQLPLKDGQPSSADRRHSCDSGFVTADGLTLHVSFGEAVRGDWLIPALADYLCSNGCRLTRYQISPSFAGLNMINF